MSIWSEIAKSRLRRSIRHGQFEVTFPNGETTRFGTLGQNQIRIAVTTDAWLRRILLDPELELGEAYMQGGLILEAGDLYELLDLLWRNLLADGTSGGALPAFLRKTFRALAQFNPQAPR